MGVLRARSLQPCFFGLCHPVRRPSTRVNAPASLRVRGMNPEHFGFANVTMHLIQQFRLKSAIH